MITATEVIAVGTSLTSLTLIPLFWQIRWGRKQATTDFEDRMVDRYRDILRELPVAALLGEDLGETRIHAHLGAFYRYFDLCNEQVVLRRNNRVSIETWRDWAEGMNVNLRKQPFEGAWAVVNSGSLAATTEDTFFNGLRYFRRGENHRLDPRSEWPARWRDDVVAPEPSALSQTSELRRSDGE